MLNTVRRNHDNKLVWELFLECNFEKNYFTYIVSYLKLLKKPKAEISELGWSELRFQSSADQNDQIALTKG